MLGRVLDDPMPPVSPEQAERLADKYFGLLATATPLAGERDRNFHLVDRDGAGWVLKVVHPAEEPEFTELQSRVLLHIAGRDPSLRVPRVRRPVAGGTSAVCEASDGVPAGCRVRVYTYLSGTPLQIGSGTRRLRMSLGSFLGRLDRALSDLSVRVRPTGLAWDAQHVGRFGDLLRRTEPALVSGFFEHFGEHTSPALRTARRQLIHNDFNPRNVLTGDDTDQVVGVIDFGDMVHGPLIQDLATAAAYQIGEQGPPLQGPGDVIRGYHAVMPLRHDEFDLLLDLIRARLLLTIAITSRRAQAGHADPRYILRNSGLARRSLERLATMRCTDAADLLRAQCGVE